MSEKPTAAFVLSLIGGLIILLVAIVIMAVMSAIGGFMIGVGAGPNIALIYGAVGVIFALIVIVGAVMLYMKPHQPVAWGGIVLLLSLFRIISTGRLFICLIFCLVGGILGCVWGP